MTAFLNDSQIFLTLPATFTITKKVENEKYQVITLPCRSGDYCQYHSMIFNIKESIYYILTIPPNTCYESLGIKFANY